MQCLLTWFAIFLAANNLDNDSAVCKTCLTPILGFCATKDLEYRNSFIQVQCVCTWYTEVSLLWHILTPVHRCVRTTKNLQCMKSLILVQRVNTFTSLQQTITWQNPTNTPQPYTYVGCVHRGHFSGGWYGDKQYEWRWNDSFKPMN